MTESTAWLCSIEPELSGLENMARDRAIAEATSADGIPRLRFYSWTPWTLSLGYNQKDDRIDAEALGRAGYDLVRRPTGGRAVFHAEEITYGVAMPTGDEGVHATYARISNALRLGFEGLGAKGVSFSRSDLDMREHYEQLDSEGCFSASALNELTVGKRKLVGSAQRRYGSTLLQHGSILLDDAHLQIVDFLSIVPDLRDGMRQRLASKTATLREIIDGDLPSFEEIARHLAEGFAREFGSLLDWTEKDVTHPRTKAENSAVIGRE